MLFTACGCKNVTSSNTCKVLKNVSNLRFYLFCIGLRVHNRRDTVGGFEVLHCVGNTNFLIEFIYKIS